MSSGNSMIFRVVVMLLMQVACGVENVTAQVARPPRPETYDVQIRYRIRTDRDERIRQYRAMEAYLKSIGFTPTKRPNDDLDIFDSEAELLVGTIPSGKALDLFRQASIRTVLLTPTGTAAAEPRKMTQVRLGLGTGLPPDEQRKLHGQIANHLSQLGFQEAIAYDHVGYSIMRGSLPAGVIPQLLKDLRSLPGGWFLPAISRDQLPSPLRGVLPIRLIEVLPELPETPPATFAPASGKLTPDILAILGDPARAEQPLVVEAVSLGDADLVEREARGRLRVSGAGSTLEGFAGTSGVLRLTKAKFVEKLAASDEVWAVRLPRAGAETARVAASESSKSIPSPKDVVKSTNLGMLHELGYRGDGIRAVVIASGFDGLEIVKEEKPRYPGLVAVRGKGLPAAWLYDFTGETDPTITSLPPDPNRGGTGTATAVALAAAAPGSTLILVRVDPTAFHQVFDIAKAVVGTAGYTAALQSRLESISITSDLLRSRRRAAVDEYRKAFSNLSDDEIPRKRRVDAADVMAKLLVDEAVFQRQVERFTAMKAGLDSLSGSRVVVNTLVWEAGYPNDGLSALSRLIESAYTPSATKSAIRADRTPPPPVWVQAAGMGVSRAWSGPFRDVDRNGVMEFAGPAAKIPSQSWNHELNYLSYSSFDGKSTATVPAGSKIRVSMQWREPHNREAFLPSEPSYPMRLRLLRQLDPEAKTISSDEFVEVARSSGPAIRLLKSPGSGVYEVNVDFTVPAEAVYALRVEGSTLERDVLPSIRQTVEIVPRISIEMLDGAESAKGFVRFATYSTQTAGVGIPGDSIQAVAVGAGRPDRPTSMVGAGPDVELRIKPETYIADAIEWDGKLVVGSGVAVGYAGGVAVCLSAAGVRKSDVTRTLGLKPGQQLVLPEPWVRTLTPKPSPTGR